MKNDLLERAMAVVGFNASELEALAKAAAKRAAELRAAEPSYALAIAAGVVDDTYETVRYGFVRSYKGEATVTMEDGSVWIARGEGPLGDAHSIRRDGRITFERVKGGGV